MKLNTRFVSNAALMAAGILTLSAGSVLAQTPDAQTAKLPFVNIPARITQAIDDNIRVTLRGNVHPLAQPQFDKGAVADSQPMNRMLLLLQRSPEQEAALRQLLDEQQSKDSPNFHKWLTPAQFGQQFGPADADLQTVTAWLISHGFHDIRVGAGRTVVEFSGNAGQVRETFHSSIHRYLFHGVEHSANADDPQIPASLVPVVSGLRSLHNFLPNSHLRSAGTYVKEEKSVIRPFLTGGSGVNQFFAVAPADFATIYNVPSTLTGAGATIAIVGDSNINPQDVTDFRTLFGLPVSASNPKIILNGPDPGIAGSEGEADLDVQWSGAVAPGAQVDFVVSEDTLSSAGIDLSAEFIVDNNIADVMSESFGVCEAGLSASQNAFYNNLWEQAAAQGITVVLSTGDGGSAGCDDFNTAKAATNGLGISGFASTPFNVAVGGTDFDDVGQQTAKFWNTTNTASLGSAKGYIPETVWNLTCAASGSLTGCSAPNGIVAGSGGKSTIYPKPSWQSGITPATDTTRDIPDVSLFASVNSQSNSFYLVCQADSTQAGAPPSCASSGAFSFQGVGGTSASAPSFAGIMALIVQKTGQRQGNANFVLYKIAQGEQFSACNSTAAPLTGSACVFYDVTKGNNAVPCGGGTPNCSSKTAGTSGVLVDPKSTTTAAWTTAQGYDPATGLGSVNVANLATAWATAVGAFRGTNTTLTLNGGTTAITVTHGLGISTVIGVTPSVGVGTPTGDVSIIGIPANPPNASLGIDATTLTAGTTTFTSTFFPGGTYPVHAHYPGDGTFAASDSNAVTVTVTPEASKAVPTLITENANGSTCNPTGITVGYGTPYIFRVDVNTTGAFCTDITNRSAPTGTVTLKDGGNPLDGGTFSLNSEGFFEDQPIQLNAGTHSIVAAYSGDASYNANTAAAFTVNVTQAATQTTVASNLSTVASGGMVTLTATIATQSNGAGPTGTATFTLNGAAITNGTVTVTPVAATTTTPASATATLTTAVSALLPLAPGPSPRIPVWHLVMLAAALLSFWLTYRMPKSRRQGYVYASLILLAATIFGFVGCGGGGSTTPVQNSKTATISVKYGGDTNYISSTGQTSITIQ